MPAIGTTYVAPDLGSGLERLERTRVESAESEKARLKEAAKEFEAFFNHYLLKTMRETIPENALTKDLPFSNSNGREIYTDLFDMELARNISGGKEGSIGDILYRQMEPLIDAKYGQTETQSELNPLRTDADGIAVRARQYLGLPQSSHFRTLNANASQRSDTVDLPADEITARFGREINTAAEAHELEPRLIHAVILKESNGDPSAQSRAGAKGLMQLMDTTARAYGAEDSFDPAQNVMAGSKYLKELLDRFGDLELALAAYNAGPTAVRRHQGVPPYPETVAYVDSVMEVYRTSEESEILAKAKEGSHRDR